MTEPTTRPTTEFIPPQFCREDYLIWLKWKDELEKRYTLIEYSVCLGGDLATTQHDPALSKMWERITARRVDAIGHARDHIALIEFRKFAGPSAIGQLMMYKCLYRREKNPALPIKLVLVSDIVTDPIAVTCKDAGIEVALVRL